jgi:hypothetical protein
MRKWVVNIGPFMSRHIHAQLHYMPIGILNIKSSRDSVIHRAEDAHTGGLATFIEFR